MWNKKKSDNYKHIIYIPSMSSFAKETFYKIALNSTPVRFDEMECSASSPWNIDKPKENDRKEKETFQSRFTTALWNKLFQIGTRNQLLKSNLSIKHQ